MAVTATLSWTEYYNGAWQTVRTSDVAQPIQVTDQYPMLSAPPAFRLASVVLADDTLGIQIVNPVGNPTWFHLYTSHGLPLRADDEPQLSIGFAPPRSFSPYAPNGSLTLTVTKGNQRAFKILRSVQTPYTIVTPLHATSDPLATPFFFQDHQNVFYVGETLAPTSRATPAFGIFPSPPPRSRPAAPRRHRRRRAIRPHLARKRCRPPSHRGPRRPRGRRPAPVPPERDLRVRLDSPAPVSFDGTLIGPTGPVGDGPQPLVETR